MAAKPEVRRVQKALQHYRAAEDPLAALDAALELRAAAEALEADKVRELRAAGVTWTQIGARYGMTKQGAQQRFKGAKSAG